MATYNFTGRDTPGSIRIDDPRKMELCKKCMACCMKVGFQMFEPTIDQMEFYKTRGFKIHNEGRGWKSFSIEQICQHLDVEGRTGCKIYEHRPQICRDFDGRNTATLKGECAWEML